MFHGSVGVFLEIDNRYHILIYSGWPLVGNEGMKLYMVLMGIHSLIPY